MVRPKKTIPPKERHEFCTPLPYVLQAGTSVCRHALFPALGGTRKDVLEKGSRLLNPTASVEKNIWTLETRKGIL
jgi:hypothetical protein